jgi:hypothetical protein
MRKPAEYADALSFSAPYLNQLIKASAWFAVSYWIQKMIINEAKVLLSATWKPVTDIAYELGYRIRPVFRGCFPGHKRIVTKVPIDKTGTMMLGGGKEILGFVPRIGLAMAALKSLVNSCLNPANDPKLYPS